MTIHLLGTCKEPLWRGNASETWRLRFWPLTGNRTRVLKKQAPHTCLTRTDPDTSLTSCLLTNVLPKPESSKWLIPHNKMKKTHVHLPITPTQKNKQTKKASCYPLSFQFRRKNKMVLSMDCVHTKTHDDRLERWHPITQTLLPTGLSACTRRSRQGWQNMSHSCDPARTLQSISVHHLRPQTSMTPYLEPVPPVLLDSNGLGGLVAMVTLPRHSGGPPECTGMAEKGSVSPLVLFTGLTGDGEEGAHRKLRVRVWWWEEAWAGSAPGPVPTLLRRMLQLQW